MEAASTLTARQARFVEEYLVGGSATQAAIRAGYAASGAYTEASRLLRNVQVARAIKTRQEADSARLGLSRDRLVAMLLQAYEQAREKAEPAAMVAACRELGRMLGFYAATKVEATVDLGATAMRGRMEALSDAELLRMIEQSGEG